MINIGANTMTKGPGKSGLKGKNIPKTWTFVGVVRTRTGMRCARWMGLFGLTQYFHGGIVD